MEIKKCKCGGEAEWVKLWESKRYDGFVRCTKCGREGRTYTSKQNAVKRWNGGYVDDPDGYWSRTALGHPNRDYRISEKS